MVLFIFSSRNKVGASVEILGRLLDNIDYPDDQIETMTWQKKNQN